jgi:hypothetical protein
MPTSITERLHQRLHKLPGMPAHAEAARLNQHRHAHHHRSPSGSNGQHARPPRVLVAWQNRIASLFTGRGGRR